MLLFCYGDRFVGTLAMNDFGTEYILIKCLVVNYIINKNIMLVHKFQRQVFGKRGYERGGIAVIW